MFEWNGQPFLQLFSAINQGDNIYSNVTKLPGKINTKYHESTVSFMPSKKTMFFTRNNFFDNRLKEDGEGVNRLQIYKATMRNDGTWGNEEFLSFNSEEYSVAHPAVNSSGTKIYFASDMPGTIGSSDLFVADIYEDGSIGVPINLGGLLNTEGNETFPYINSKGDLYFSSNGFTGLGGLDVFMVRDFESKYDAHELYVLENVGKPINSAQDDFAYYENLKTREGFFTSNRIGGKGDDDIYSFKVPECIQNIEGVVLDGKTNKILAGCKVRLFDSAGKMSEITVGEDAKFTFMDLKCNKEYLIRVDKENYTSDEKRIITMSNPRKILKLNLEITPNEIAIGKGVNLKEALDLNPIYWSQK